MMCRSDKNTVYSSDSGDGLYLHNLNALSFKLRKIGPEQTHCSCQSPLHKHTIVYAFIVWALDKGKDGLVRSGARLHSRWLTRLE